MVDLSRTYIQIIDFLNPIIDRIRSTLCRTRFNFILVHDEDTVRAMVIEYLPLQTTTLADIETILKEDRLQYHYHTFEDVVESLRSYYPTISFDSYLRAVELPGPSIRFGEHWLDDVETTYQVTFFLKNGRLAQISVQQAGGYK
jgi:hypothetical protein